MKHHHTPPAPHHDDKHHHDKLDAIVHILRQTIAKINPLHAKSYQTMREINKSLNPTLRHTTLRELRLAGELQATSRASTYTQRSRKTGKP